jgi:uncharacterized membrane protein YsdA (DUF1294 family)
MTEKGEIIKRRLAGKDYLLVVILLILPVWTVLVTPWLNWKAVLPALVFFSALNFWTIRLDKKKAIKNEWRVAEAQLHLLELLGGWPGSYLGQRRFAHKTAKLSYQVIFWLIVVIYQILSVELLTGGKLSGLLVS